jgi:ankyrin repeat protein
MTRIARARFLLVILAFASCLAGCVRRRVDPTALNHQLLEAVENGDAASVKKLLQKGANIGAKDENGETALTKSASRGDCPFVALLLDRGVSAEDKNQALFSATSDPPLVFDEPSKKAIQQVRPCQLSHFMNHAGVAILLLDHGASPEARDGESATPLVRAASHGATAVVKVLLERGADPNARDKDGDTALISAACDCAVIDMPSTIDAMKLLLERGVSVDAKNDAGNTALIAAAGWGRADIMKLLLQNGASINERNKDGDSALTISASDHAVSTADATRLLLESGANIEAKNNDGKTPLILAASGNGYDQITIVKLLLGRGANALAKDKHGNTALSLAKKGGNAAVARLLMNARSKPH